MNKVIEILTAVEKSTGVTISDMKSKSRATYVCQARFMAFYLMYKNGLSMDKIAKEFNKKDHSPVSHGLVQHEDLMFTNHNYKYQFQQIKVVPIERKNVLCRHSRSLCMLKKVDLVYPF